jgi:two-component system, chemotaxis family, response regulator Rcp1
MNVLFVEDNEAEQLIMKEAFKAAGSKCGLSIVKNGVEAMALLKKEAPYESVITPNLIILDLSLPKKNGREVLAEIKSNPKLMHIPILIFSNSESQRDICECYSLHVNAYMNKPADFEGFIDLAHVIDVFWLKLVRYCTH